MTETRPSTPRPSHMVLNVRDIEKSHHFYTEMLGFTCCAQYKDPRNPQIDMRFYRGSGDRHHDFALIQAPDPDGSGPIPEFSMFPPAPGIVHIAIDYADSESFVNQLTHLQANGVEFKVRGNHGMTHSAYILDPDGNGIEVLYDLPNYVWENDVNAALNFFEPLPKTGPEALVDSTEYPVFGEPSADADTVTAGA